MTSSRTVFVITGVVCVCVGFGFGFLGGWFGKPDDDSGNEDLARMTRDEDSGISKMLLDEINPENIRRYLDDLTAHPHLAGTPADLDQALELKDFWENEAGLDHVQLYPYNVTLSYPELGDPDKINRIELYDNDQAVYTSQLFEKILRPEQNQSDVVPPFNAFSAAGQPEGQLVYVNYGRIEDFKYITEDRQINVTGHICIARYGQIFRGDKAKFAEQFGCLGLIMYTDPADYAPNTGSDKVYPDSWSLPGTGVQRGSLYLEGDPPTPGYPAIDSAYRMPENEAGLPTIPVHPIGYDDAKAFLEVMAGPEASADWSGELPITYRLGPGFTHSGMKVKMFVYTHTKNVTTYNAVGFIRGELEPDRYVMLGNHRDAWVFGSLDPSSGTAVMKEVSRAFGTALKNGWRPRRSIVFCSWGAEEYGLVGSREWVEQFGKLFSDRAVAYLNVDIAVQGNFTLRGKAMPLLHQLLYDVAKQIPNPNPAEVAAGRETIYDTWATGMPLLDENGQPTGLPRIYELGSGSDFAPFVAKEGIASVDFRYHYDPGLGLSSYPLYHSVYETFHLVETHYDPDFTYHKAVGQFWAELARRLSDKYVIPYDVRQYGVSLKSYVKNVEDAYKALMEEHDITGMDFLHQAVSKFENAIDGFMMTHSEADLGNPVEIRMLNDRMMNIDRIFIDPNGLPGRPLLRNVVFAPSAHDSYAGSTFPGLVDTLYELEHAQEADKDAKVVEVRQQLAIITFFIDLAASSLMDTIEFH